MVNDEISILLAEDDINVITFMQVLFRKNNIENIVFAANGKEALSLYKKNKYDIVITDIQMPLMDGFELIDNIRLLDKKQIFIVITGQDSKEQLVKAIKYRVNFFLQKPIDTRELKDILEDSISLAQERKALALSERILNQYKNAIDSTTIVSKTDPDGNITYVNDKFIKISGFLEEELIGKQHSIVRDPSMKDTIFTDLWNTISNKKIWKGVVTNRTKDGSQYIVNVTIVPILDDNNEIQEYIAIRHDITEFQKIKEEIEELHKKTKDSIEYASLIQHSLIPDNDIFKKYFTNYMVIWHPKDIVGGDIYLFEELRNDDECMLMVIDCTGHGVPGAFVTMIVKSIERQVISNIINSEEDVSPAEIMSNFNKTMKQLLKQDDDTGIANAGFDGAIVYYNKKDKKLKFCGANTPLFYINEKKELNVIKGNRQSVGYRVCKENYEYTEYIIDVKDDMQFYLSTDGYFDQNGGDKGFPFGKKRFVNIIKEYHEESFADQQEVFLDELCEYQAKEERNDDITLISFKI